MIHIATVHWNSARWIDIQLKYLARFLGEPYRVYTYLTGFPTAEHNEKFHYAANVDLKGHAPKLNQLFKVIDENAHDDDVVIFLDGDAFPIAPLGPRLREKLAKYPLTAIVQRENNGDRQPHPCFCATTVGFWKELKGDWVIGSTWKNDLGLDVADVGGRVLESLTTKKIKWLPLYRSNYVNLHPLWFGIYDDLIYHHGSGFRTPESRFDKYEILKASRDEHVKWLLEKKLMKGSVDDGTEDPASPFGQELATYTAKLEALFAEVFTHIQTDDDFFRKFMS